jgi:hypothetical protein
VLFSCGAAVVSSTIIITINCVPFLIVNYVLHVLLIIFRYYYFDL